ncbi:MAG: hypothetical protein KKB50_06030 [Planctomycetes bacterium]|nr:hypothetical protein [Planctomycetota bacterium]
MKRTHVLLAGIAITLGFFILGSPRAYAQPDLTCGNADEDGGTIVINVKTKGGVSRQKSVSIAGGRAAADKASDIKEAFEAGTGAADWRVSQAGAALTFEHKKPNGTWERVSETTVNRDETGEFDVAGTWSTQGAYLDFGLDDSFPATGFDASGNPSIVSFLTGIGAIDVPVSPGDTAALVVQSVYDAMATAGADIQWTSASSFCITDPSPNAWLAWQSTDTALPIRETGICEFPEPATLVLLALGGLRLLGRR